MKPFRSTIQDFVDALKRYRLWLHLGSLEVKQRYRRSVLGPWWISMSMLIFIAVMSVIYSRLFSENFPQYVVFFTSGFLLWSFIASCLNEATDIFRINNNFIKQIKLPYNLYMFRFLTKHLSVLAHTLVVYLLVILVFQKNPGWEGLFAIPGILLLVVNMYWLCLLVALIGTRFRDTVPIINSIVQILFFVTPITWMPKLLGESSIIVKLNPIIYILDPARMPMLGIIPPLSTWMIDIGIACIGYLVTFNVFGLVHRRIPFWVD